jgi:hypothetical protein
MIVKVRISYLHPALIFLQQLGKPIGDQQRCVDEPVHTISHAGLFAFVQLVARLLDAFVPANFIEFVDLTKEERRRVRNGHGKAEKLLHKSE